MVAFASIAAAGVALLQTAHAWLAHAWAHLTGTVAFQDAAYDWASIGISGHAAALAAAIGAVWKLLGKLAYPFLYKWLSRGPMLGILRLVTLRRTRLKQRSLEAITKALRAFLPLKATQVYIEYLHISLGFFVGVKLRATVVRVELQWTSVEEWERTVVKDIKEFEIARSHQEASAFIKLVQAHLSRKGAVPTCVARVIELFICKAAARVDSFQVVIKDPRCGPGAELELNAGLRLSSSRSSAIEWRGTRLWSSLSLGFKAGGRQLLESTELELQRLELPHVLRTLLMPLPLPSKRLNAELLVKSISCCMQSASMAALLHGAACMKDFSEWKAMVEEESRSSVVPLRPGDKDAYAEALSRGEGLAKWEERMTCAEILDVYSEMHRWPVPHDTQLQTWLQALAEEQRPIRALSAKVSIQSVRLEVLANGDRPGRGISARLEELSTSACLHDLPQREPEPAVLKKSWTAWSQATSTSSLTAPLGSADSGELPRSGNSVAGAFEPAALREAGPTRLSAAVSFRSLEVLCEPAGSVSVPVLEPCTLQVDCRVCEVGSKQSAFVQATVSKEICCNFSSRALYRMQVALNDLAHATPAELMLHRPELQRRGSVASTLSIDGDPVVPTSTVVLSKRRAAHLEEMRRLFNAIDKDRSGYLDRQEVHDLIVSMYGHFMTLKELDIATGQLWDILDEDGSGTVSFEELQAFYLRQPADDSNGSVCLCLGEFAHPVPDGFDAWAEFQGEVCGGSAQDLDMAAEVIQLRWVRTLRNYLEGKKLWVEEIAPKLDRKYQAWRLSESVLATDFWNDPTFSLKKMEVSEGVVLRSRAMQLLVDLRGISIRLADSQHMSSMPRVRINLQHTHLQGGIVMPAGQPPMCQSMTGMLALQAQYWNSLGRQLEWFIEPWNLQLEAEQDHMSIRAERHFVMNVTPPLLQALSVAVNSLESADSKGSAVARTEEDGRPVLARIFNSTMCDITVHAHGSEGDGKPVHIPRGQAQAGVAVELPTQLELSQRQGGHILSRAWSNSLTWSSSKGGEQPISSSTAWTLLVEGKDGQQAWQVSEEISISVTGRRIYPDVSGKRLLAVDVQVDVLSLAPIVVLSGIYTLRNMTTKTLRIKEEAGGFFASVGPQESWRAGLRGGLSVSFDVGAETINVPMPGDEDEPAADRDKAYIKTHGFVFTLEQQNDLLKSGQVLERTLICVPMLRALNALPCTLRCQAKNITPQRMRLLGTSSPEPQPEEPDLESLPPVRPGEYLGFDDIDPMQPIMLTFYVAGEKFTATIPPDSITRQKALAKAKRLKGARAIRLVPADYKAAQRLDLDLVWEGYGTVATVFSNFWVSNKSGYELRACSGMKLLPTGRAVPIDSNTAEDVTLKQLAGSSWVDEIPVRRRRRSSSKSTVVQPELALMRAQNNSLRFRLRSSATETASQWAWDDEEGPLAHWCDDHTGEWKTGWSNEVGVEISNTTGVARLPPQSLLNSKDRAEAVYGATVGVSITDLPPPFLRSKLVTVAPRYVVRNDLDREVQIWPTMGYSRRVPADNAPPGLPTVKPGSHLAIDAIVPPGFMSAAAIHARAQALLTHGLLPLISIRFHDASRHPPAPASGGVHDRPSPEAPGEETPAAPFEGIEGATEFFGPWSTQVPISIVGDAVFTLGRGDAEDPYRIVRASVQLIGATVFVVLVKGQWEYCVKNCSLAHTIALHQESPILKEDFCTLKPCQYQSFCFPDPDMPKILQGRITGAGRNYVVAYDLDDVSGIGRQTPLRLQANNAILEADLEMVGSTRVLSFHDALQMRGHGLPVSGRQRLRRSWTQQAQHADETSGLATMFVGLHLEVFVMGIHICLIDTLLSTPEELVAFTIDNVQLEKPKMERTVELTVHHMQFDDFNQEEHYVLGPSDSGLNSQRDAFADSTGFKSRPLLTLVVAGPRHLQTAIFDAERSLLTLEAVVLNLRPLEAFIDVSRIMALGRRLKSWQGALKIGGGAGAGPGEAAAGASPYDLSKVLRPGFHVPSTGGQTICNIGRVQISDLVFLADLKLKKRQGGGDRDQEDEDLDTQLQKEMAGMSPTLRVIASFFARLGTSFAEARPRFAFAKLKWQPGPMNIEVVKQSLLKGYLTKLQWQAAGVLGSLQVLGDPAGFVTDVKSGFATFVKKTGQELRGERQSFGGGVQDLAGNTFGAVFASVATISGSLKDTVGSLAGRPMGDEVRARDIGEGLNLSMKSIADGVSEAVTGLVEQPLEQFELEGVVGLAKGSVQGLAGVIARPCEGMLGAVEKVAQGAEGQVRHMRGGYDGLRRPPRVAFQGGGDGSHRGFLHLEEGFFWPKWRMGVISVNLPRLWIERRVRHLAISFFQDARSDQDPESKVVVVRGEVADVWALGGKAPQNSVALGRVGCLRGPFQLQVEALVDANLQMTEPLPAVVGMGQLPLSDLTEALERSVAQDTQLCFEIRARASPLMSDDFCLLDGEAIGKVTVEFGPSIDPTILPKRFIPDDDDYLPKLGPAAGAAPAATEAPQRGPSGGGVDGAGLRRPLPESPAVAAPGRRGAGDRAVTFRVEAAG